MTLELGTLEIEDFGQSQQHLGKEPFFVWERILQCLPSPTSAKRMEGFTPVGEDLKQL